MFNQLTKSLTNKDNIIKLIKTIPIISIILVAITVVLISIGIIHKHFEKHLAQTKARIQNTTIQNTIKDLNAIHEVIITINNIILNSYKKEVKMAVGLGYSAINVIYHKYQNRPKQFIINKIKEDLRHIRFFGDKSGYYFIYNMKGDVILLPIKPSLEGKNLLNHKDIKGHYIIKSFIQKLHKHNATFETWYYYKPNTNKILKKLGYAMYFKPLDIFIGSAVYYDNIQTETCRKIKQVLSKMNINSNIFLLNEHKIIYTNSKLDISKYYKDIIEIAKYSKDRIVQFKKDNKLFIIHYCDKFNTALLKVLDLNKLQDIIQKNEKEMDYTIKTLIKNFLIITGVFVGIILLVILKLTKIIENTFNKYEEELIKEKENAQAAAKVKSEFLANMSHEIRTPLNAMFGFLKILKEKDLDQESKKYLDIIEKSGKNLLIIINDILDFSKIESGKMNIEYIEFNPKEEIEAMCELFKSKAKEKNIELVTNIDLEYNIVSDPTRIKQVIANLLSNAIKFTPNNKKITLNVKYDQNKEELFVEVIDEGIGIPQDKLNTIFEAFSQADNSTTRKYGGTGLGLAISYRLIKLLGGELKVESQEQKGSRFYFTIPAKKGKKITQTPHKEKTQKIEDKKYNYHILVVEDNPANQMFMKVILQKMGITFDIANDGVEAVEKFKENKYDLILMDENMPRMSGREATKEIRKIELTQKLSPTIIVALTANAIAGDKEKFILAGMDYYLSKPLDIEKLKEIFEEIHKRIIKS
ncbi:MAG: response regulator [Epsilonproteobacteria bacterium]|nr:response regulator [Campylobacterota bacterium]